jgi:predicted nucleotidyltransferase
MKINGILQINDNLNSVLWRGEKFSSAIRDKLLEIAEKFFNNLNLNVDLSDITVTGSMVNYNWTKYSDIDLHLIVDFSEVDENKDLVREFFSAKTSNWNKNHNISFFGHEIEIYVQNLNEKHHSTGIYSLLREEWLVKPTRVEPKIDVQMVKRKADSFIDMIDRAEDLYYDKNYEEAYDFSLKLINRIKTFRKSGLEDSGEYSNENLAFKYLRNHEHTKALFDIRNNSYDKMMSIGGDHDKKFRIFIEKEESPEETGFHRLNEIGKFQKRVRRKHNRLKRLNIGKGRQKPGKPYTKKPSYKRSKSAPVGFGGA